MKELVSIERSRLHLGAADARCSSCTSIGLMSFSPRTVPQRQRQARSEKSFSRSPWLGSLVAVGVLAACGGADAPSASTPGAPVTATQIPSPSNPVEAANSKLSWVVDTESEGFTTSGSFVTRDGPRGSKLWHGQGGASANFVQTIAAAGFHEVFVRWPLSPERGVVEITIESQEGSHTVQVDQRAQAGEWISVGAYPLEARAKAKVSLRSAQGQPFVVGAVRWQQKTAAQAQAAFATDKLPLAVVNEDYLARLTTAGGKPPFKFALEAKALPDGLVLDAATGTISGRPTRAGQFAATLTLLDARGQTARGEFNIGVAENVGGASDPVALTLPHGSKAAAGPVRNQAYTGAAPDLSSLRSVIAAMPEGEWSRVNLNRFDSAWTPEGQRPLLYGVNNPTPASIIDAWSGFAWDSNRGELFLYGGGHASYTGNDTYQWRGSTRSWVRSSLPSEIVQTPQGLWQTVDGPTASPVAAHAFDNTIFLPIADRVLVLGGGVYNHSAHYLAEASPTTTRITGPYFFDPNRADGSKVGGATGSHVQRVAPHSEVVGGQMWSNRESWLNASATSTPPAEHFINGCTGYSVENGHDVVYYRSYRSLYRYEVVDVDTPALDRWSQVGMYWYSYGTTSTCAYDSGRKIFLSTNENEGQPFVFWNLATPGPNNRDVLFTPVDPTGEFMTLWNSGALKTFDCALDFDPVRANYKLWCGDGRIWVLSPPSTSPVTSAGWTITKAPSPVGIVPSEPVFHGIMGKWKYIPNLDVFLGLAGRDVGNIWIYKPVGWTNPGGGNQTPLVDLTTPPAGTSNSVTLGTSIPIAAQASDPDGSISKVEFFANGNKVGERTASPFGMVWSTAGLGTHVISAIATDNAGASTTSAAVSVTVVPPVVANVPPTAAWLQPAEGGSINVGLAINLEASATDSDGSIAKVEFYDGPALVGTATAAPFRVVWTNAALGAHSLNVVVTDDKGATASASRSITVRPVAVVTVETKTIQRGIGSSSSMDMSLANGDSNTGNNTTLLEQGISSSVLVRFPIFVSEGGPVPNGAVIDSATLSLYRSTKGSVTYSLHRVLQDWSESSATWRRRTANQNWAVSGANGAGTDYDPAEASRLVSSTAAAWQNFDLTANVQAMSNASTPGNFGWRLRRIAGDASTQHRFYSSEYASTAYRPKLVVTYRVLATQ